MRWLTGCVMTVFLSVPALAQTYPPPPATLVQQAPPDPRQFCYFNGQPYSMGSPYPGNARGTSGGGLRCEPSDQAVNGYIMLEWSDRR